MVTTFYPPYSFGGDAMFVQALSEALVERGHEVDVVHCEDAYRLKDSQPIATSPSPNITVYRLKTRLGKLSPLITQQTGKPGVKQAKLESIFDRNYDVVNFHNISLIGGPKILTMSKAPINIYTLHEHWLLCPTHIFWKNGQQACDRRTCFSCCVRSQIPPQLWRYTSLIGDSLNNIDLILSPSHYTAQRHREGGIEAKIEVLPTFSRLAAESIPEHRSQTRPSFLYVGRITASKGIQVLLADFAELEEYDLYVAGDGELKAALTRQYAERANIHWLGSVSKTELVQLYQGVTATILPSLASEVFPLTILESFACGTPVIAHNAGGSREAIDRTGGGIVYDSQSDFYRAVHLLAKNPTRRSQMGKAARAGYEKYYTPEHYLNSYLKTIDSIRHKKAIALETKVSTP